MEYRISLDEQNRILATVDKRTDAEAARIKRYLAMPDLSRTPGSPLYEIVTDRVQHVGAQGIRQYHHPGDRAGGDQLRSFRFCRQIIRRAASRTRIMRTTRIFCARTTR